jgi:putative CocE/NonD family hydrolase
MVNIKFIFSRISLICFVYGLCAVTASADTQNHYVQNNYTKLERMIPMRDHCQLFTQIYIPRDQTKKYGIIFERTPYSVGHYGQNRTREVLGPNPLYAHEGFIFVYQDIRGTYKSEGDFVVMRPYLQTKNSNADTDESSDTYDTIEWLLNNIPNHNGRVIQWGTSYSGWLTVMGMIDAHQALKASMVQAPPADMWIGDDFHHNGAFRLMYTFSWLLHNTKPRNEIARKYLESFDFQTTDGYKFFLELGPIKNVNEKYFHHLIPTWNDYLQHGNYDEYWQKQNCLQHLQNINHPVLIVAGWFDAEDFYGPTSVYQSIEKQNKANSSTLVVGPWKHSGWNWMEGDRLGDIGFGQSTGVYFRQNIEFPFFTYYLKDKTGLNLPEALVFETGSNQWRSYDCWPPDTVSKKKLFLHNKGKLAFHAPQHSNEEFDSFISDPDDPIPWSTEKRTTQGHLWMIEDQRFVADRPDVLTFQSDILEKDIAIAGPITAVIYCSTTGTDADWIVKLIDVFPDSSSTDKLTNADNKMNGYQMLLAGDVFRSKYRKSFEIPEPLESDEIVEIKFNIGDRNHRFLKGHRIMVQIQSTWFPVIDRNPQKFIDIYHAEKEDFQKAEHRIYHSKKYPSHIEIKKIY